MPQSPALYVRLSSDPGQDRKGVERQKRLMKAQATSLGWSEPTVYEDNDTSSKKGVAREHFERMLTDLDHGLRDGVMFWKADRFSRETKHYDALKEAGVLVATESRVYDPTKSEDMHALRMEAANAERETKRTSERMLAQRLEAAEEGRRHGAPAFGWGKRSKKGIWKKRDRINPEEAAAIRDGLQRVLRGDSLISIMRDWNSQGIKTSRGRDWSSTTVRSVLERWSNAGVRQHQGKPLFDVQGTWEPITDVATIQAVRAILANNPRQTTTTRARRHLLTGVLRCECGSFMKGQHVASSARMARGKTGPGPEKRSTHYKCDSNTCGRSVPYDDANTYVLKWLGLYLMFKSPAHFLPGDAQVVISDITKGLEAVADRRSKIYAADISEGDRLQMLSGVNKDEKALRARLGGYASQSALSRLVGSLTAIPFDGVAPSFDIAADRAAAIRERFLAKDLKSQKDTLQALATFTVGVGFSEPNEKGTRRKLRASERIMIEPRHG